MKKLSHEAADYHASASLKRRCSTCSMYERDTPPSCTLVQSPIKAQDVCKHYEEKKRAA